MNITEKNTIANKSSSNALFELGFRPFFLGASLLAITSMFIWALNYHFNITIAMEKISYSQWHAHEMLYGYTFAVIAGFLLTAVKNWTGLPTLTGFKLALVFFCWLIARVLFLFGTTYMLAAAVFDLIFSLAMIIAITIPIVKVRQWNQMSIIGKVILLFIGNTLFYLGFFSSEIGVTEVGSNHSYISLGLYGGLYLILGLILTMGRRVIPFFIENGVDINFKAKNYHWIDITSLIIFLAFFVIEIFFSAPMISALLAVGIFAINLLRLIGWYTHHIWKHALLWSLYLSFVWITLGFLLFAGGYFFGVSPFIALHALASGAIAMVTMGMMARVSLGHTGRNVKQPPKGFTYALLLLFAASIVRVFGPLLDTANYMTWIASAQILWIIAFTILLIIFIPILVKPRIDGL